ncbi:hypothetical protein D3C76_1019070 [compost metagenome]
MIGKTIAMYSQARGTMRKNLRIRKSMTLSLLSKKLVIRKPDKVKNIAMPMTPAAEFNCKNFGPSGSR